MQKKWELKLNLAKLFFHMKAIGASFATDRTASNCLDAGQKVQKIKEFILSGTYDADIAKYIPRTLELVFQGMLEDINRKEQLAHISYKDMKNPDFQIMLTDNYYMNPNSMHICYPMKILKSSDKDSDIHRYRPYNS